VDLDSQPPKAKRRDIGWAVLLCVAFGWATLVAGIGVPFLLGGGMVAVVIAVTDLQDGRRVSRPVQAALFGSFVILLVGFLVSRSW
jgi:uncharacterized membrane protein AbrB (regulator of aidB expression)